MDLIRNEFSRRIMFSIPDIPNSGRVEVEHGKEDDALRGVDQVEEKTVTHSRSQILYSGPSSVIEVTFWATNIRLALYPCLALTTQPWWRP